MPCTWKGLSLVWYSTVALFKFLTMFEQRGPAFHWMLDIQLVLWVPDVGLSSFTWTSWGHHREKQRAASESCQAASLPVLQATVQAAWCESIIKTNAVVHTKEYLNKVTVLWACSHNRSYCKDQPLGVSRLHLKGRQGAHPAFLNCSLLMEAARKGVC